VPSFLAEDIVLLALDARVFLLAPGTDGYQVVERRPTMGRTELVDLVFHGCRLAASRVLSVPTAAVRREVAIRRCALLAAGALGSASWCLEQAVAYAKVRQTFGRPLADRQAIQWMIADSARELHTSRLLVYQAACRLDLGEDAEEEAAAAKVLATESALRVVDRAMQIHGARGYSRDLPLERFWRELHVYRGLEGDNDELVRRHAASWLQQAQGAAGDGARLC